MSNEKNSVPLNMFLLYGFEHVNTWKGSSIKFNEMHYFGWAL